MSGQSCQQARHRKRVTIRRSCEKFWLWGLYFNHGVDVGAIFKLKQHCRVAPASYMARGSGPPSVERCVHEYGLEKVPRAILPPSHPPKKACRRTIGLWFPWSFWGAVHSPLGSMGAGGVLVLPVANILAGVVVVGIMNSRKCRRLIFLDNPNFKRSEKERWMVMAAAFRLSTSCRRVLRLLPARTCRPCTCNSTIDRRSNAENLANAAIPWHSTRPRLMHEQVLVLPKSYRQDIATSVLEDAFHHALDGTSSDLSWAGSKRHCLQTLASGDVSESLQQLWSDRSWTTALRI